MVNRRVFPREKATGALEFMLRHLLSPGRDDARQGNRNRRKLDTKVGTRVRRWKGRGNEGKASKGGNGNDEPSPKDRIK